MSLQNVINVCHSYNQLSTTAREFLDQWADPKSRADLDHADLWPVTKTEVGTWLPWLKRVNRRLALSAESRKLKGFIWFAYDFPLFGFEKRSRRVGVVTADLIIAGTSPRGGQKGRSPRAPPTSPAQVCPP